MIDPCADVLEPFSPFKKKKLELRKMPDKEGARRRARIARFGPEGA
jgi:hypothetical protein